MAKLTDRYQAIADDSRALEQQALQMRQDARAVAEKVQAMTRALDYLAAHSPARRLRAAAVEIAAGRMPKVYDHGALLAAE